MLPIVRVFCLLGLNFFLCVCVLPFPFLGFFVCLLCSFVRVQCSILIVHSFSIFFFFCFFLLCFFFLLQCSLVAWLSFCLVSLFLRSSFSTRISMRHHLVWALVNVLPGSRRRHHYWPDCVCVCVHNICSNIHQPTIHRIPCHWHSNIFPSSPSLFASHCFVYCVNCVFVCVCLFHVLLLVLSA